MQIKNWNDLRILRAVWVNGTLAATARALRMDETTVSRRLKALQTQTGAILIQRGSDGRMELTPQGVKMAAQADEMALCLDKIEDSLSGVGQTSAGTVRLTSVPLLINRLLAPATESLLTRHPVLQLELVPDSRDLSLTRREADIALRLARPRLGGATVIARRLGDLTFAVYSASGAPEAEAEAQLWIGYEDAMAHLPQAEWIAKAARRDGGRLSGLKVHDAETAIEAVAAGAGRSVLPCLIADHDARLRRVAPLDLPPPPPRELWLLVHRDLK